MFDQITVINSERRFCRIMSCCAVYSIVVFQVGVRLKNDIDLDDLKEGKGVEFTVDEDALKKSETFMPGRLRRLSCMKTSVGSEIFARSVYICYTLM